MQNIKKFAFWGFSFLFLGVGISCDQEKIYREHEESIVLEVEPAQKATIIQAPVATPVIKRKTKPKIKPTPEEPEKKEVVSPQKMADEEAQALEKGK